MDFLTNCRLNGLNLVLEKIIFSLPADAIRTCLKVSQEWSDLILSILKSSNPRLERLRDFSLKSSWKNKRAQILKLDLLHFGIQRLDCFHIVGDESVIVVAARINETEKAKVIIIDTSNDEVLNILDVKNDSGDECDVLNMKLAMDENFLAAFIDEKLKDPWIDPIWLEDSPTRSSAGQGQLDPTKNRHLRYDLQFITTWNRRQNYSESPQKPRWKRMLDHWRHRHLRNIPIIRNGCLRIYEFRNTSSEDFNYLEIDLSTNISTTKKGSIPDLKPGVVMCHSGGMVVKLFNDTSTLLIVRNDEEILWTLGSDVHLIQDVIGLSPNYISVCNCPRSPVKANSRISIHDARTGKLLRDVYLKCIRGEYVQVGAHWSLRGENKEAEIQVSNGLITVRGTLRESLEDQRNLVHDIYFIDLETGETLLRCGADLRFNSPKKFLIVNGNLILEDSGSVHLVKFWI